MGREPGSLGYYVAPFRVMAKAIAWDMLLKATAGLRVAKNESELTVTLPEQRKIALKGADDPETLEGVGLVAAVLDEFARMKLAAWEKSLRPALSDKKGRVLFCGKPRGHNHLKTFYERGLGGTKNWRSWLFTTKQGGNVSDEDIAEAKATLPAKVHRQEYEATFETAAGRIYEDFTRRVHVRSHDAIEREWKRDGRWTFRSIICGQDSGYTNNGVMLCVGVTGAGRLVVFHEEVHQQMLVTEPGWVGIARRLVADHRIDEFHCDPSEPGNIRVLREAFDSHPNVIVADADNAVGPGILDIQTALLPMADGSPGLIVSDRCVHTIREFESYVFAEVRGVATEHPAKVDDHCMDALRYASRAARHVS